MTRGKHARTVNKRRAESAEEQLDRLIPQLTDAKRLAAHYKSEAEQAPVLRRRLAELKDRNGIPVAEHVAAVAALDAKHKQEWADLQRAFDEVIDKLVEVGAIRHPTQHEWINAVLLKNLRDMPRDMALTVLRAIGVERELARGMLESGMAERTSLEHDKDILSMARMSREVLGAPPGKIHGGLVNSPRLEDILHPDDEEEG